MTDLASIFRNLRLTPVIHHEARSLATDGNEWPDCAKQLEASDLALRMDRTIAAHAEQHGVDCSDHHV
ncbi:MAG: hypothetical protein VW891_13430, partial [Novosphingobium sp.]